MSLTFDVFAALRSNSRIQIHNVTLRGVHAGDDGRERLMIEHADAKSLPTE
ncbi:hypothetical protein [Pararobbsia alpina]|uniref:hypothetical protein n=1 Tax=Pararobbsia alpina TaxID=621374 RepID=UPI0039A560D6